MRGLFARCWGVCMLIGWMSTSPSPCFAYSDPLRFDDSTELGGGAGRWFTGSPAEGYGCDVCHQGGGAPTPLEVSGLPSDGYQPGATYEITVRWPIDLPHIGMVSEFTNEGTASAGTLSLPPPETYTAEDLCDGDEAGFPATSLQMSSDGRTLVSTVDCGAHRARVRWTAPLAAEGPVWFAAGFVRAGDDDEDTPDNDATSLIRHDMAPAGSTTTPREIAQGCQTTDNPLEDFTMKWFMCMGALGLVLRRHSRAAVCLLGILPLGSLGGCVDTGLSEENSNAEVSYLPGAPVSAPTSTTGGAAPATTTATTAGNPVNTPFDAGASSTTGTGAVNTTAGSTGSTQPDAMAPVGPGTTGSATDSGSVPMTSEDAGAPDAPVEMPAGPSEGTLTLEFESVSLGGRYSPANIGAVWIETSSGDYVKTLERWAGVRGRYLQSWEASSGGWGGGGGFFGSSGTPEPDTVTSATKRSHETHSLTWNAHDVNGALVPDGSYNVKIELTDADRAGAVATVPFEKDPAGFSATPGDAPPHSGLSIRYDP